MNAAIRGQTAASAEVGALMNRSAGDLIQSSLSIGDIAVHSNTSTSTAAVTRIAGTTARNCWRPLPHPGRRNGFCCLVVILFGVRATFRTSQLSLPHGCLEDDARLIASGLLLGLLLFMVRIMHLKALVVVHWYFVEVLAERRELCRRNEICRAG